MIKLIKKQSPGRIIALGFALIILLGSFLLSMPFSIQDGIRVRYIDALYTSTSAVCVTGLIAVDAGDTFTPLGQFFLAVLIQVGGLGVTAVGAGIILAIGKKVNLKGRNIIREAMNLGSGKGTVRFIKSVFMTTLAFELTGAVLSFAVFIRDSPPLRAAGLSLFHSVAAFNNSGFDILGGLQNLIPYQDDIILNFVTCGLIFFGGIGFLVIREIIGKRFRWSKFSMHTKAVITVSIFLIAAGTLLIKLTEEVTWLGAFFHSVSARTAGFSTYPLGTFTNAGLFILVILMFIGASPGSTGGGIKTSTIFVIFSAIRRTMKNGHCVAFKRRIEDKTIMQAFIVLIMSLFVVCLGTMLLCVAEPEYSFMQLLFECVSAFGTVGLSTGITSELGVIAKIILILTMFTGRLGVMTIATLGTFKEPGTAVYTSEDISIG